MDYHIHLKNLKHFGYHGVYDEERIVGGWFEVDLKVFFQSNGLVQELSDTINYVKLTEIIHARIEVPQLLLETLCQQITADIFEHDDRVEKIDIKINKISAPIKNFSGNIEVCLSRTRN